MTPLLLPLYCRSSGPLLTTGTVPDGVTVLLRLSVSCHRTHPSHLSEVRKVSDRTFILSHSPNTSQSTPASSRVLLSVRRNIRLSLYHGLLSLSYYKTYRPTRILSPSTRGFVSSLPRPVVLPTDYKTLGHPFLLLSDVPVSCLRTSVKVLT